MFTGIIEAVGTVERVSARGNYRVLTVAAGFAGELSLGESVACDGACLTVVAVSGGNFTVEVSQETSARTIVQQYRAGSSINLERSMRADGRLGGHLVTGHIDTVGKIERALPVGESLELTVGYDQVFDSFVIEKGSIAINGVSLTVNGVDTGRCEVNLIPFTLKETTLSRHGSGSAVNLEFDLIGKYVARYAALSGRAGITMDKLRESGW